MSSQVSFEKKQWDCFLLHILYFIWQLTARPLCCKKLFCYPNHVCRTWKIWGGNRKYITNDFNNQKDAAISMMDTAAFQYEEVSTLRILGTNSDFVWYHPRYCHHYRGHFWWQHITSKNNIDESIFKVKQPSSHWTTNNTIVLELRNHFYNLNHGK